MTRLGKSVRVGAILSLLLPVSLVAQDERRVSSPDGKLEFRIFVAPQEQYPIIRIAYQVFYQGAALVQTSFMALDVWSQEPMLGESTGLISSRSESHGSYNSLFANYMQNGSLGRLLTIEARAYKDGVAFRYSIPVSTPLRDLQIADEATEFALPEHAEPGPQLPLDIKVELEPTQLAWMSISEIPIPHFPTMHLVHSEGNILLTRLAPNPATPGIVYTGTTPLTLPWRVISIATTREGLGQTTILRDLAN